MIKNSFSKEIQLVIYFLLFTFFSTAQYLPDKANSDKNSPAPLLRASCNNLDFSTGTTTNWDGKWCKNSDSTYYNILFGENLPDIGINSSGSSNQPGFVHEIMSSGTTDPNTLLSVVPPGYNFSIRLGNDKKGIFSRQVITNTFVVTEETALLTYWYSVVFSQDKGKPHAWNKKPFFRITLYNDTVNLIAPCASYEISDEIGTPGVFQTKSTGTTDIIYNNWSSYTFPLSEYIGQQVTIQFETSDCSDENHFCYAYIAANCSPFIIKKKIISADSCGNVKYQLIAPDGATTYEWIDSSSTKNTQSVYVQIPGKHTVYMDYIGKNGYKCHNNLVINIAPHPNYIKAKFSYVMSCSTPTQFFDESIPLDSITNWSWDFNNDGIEDSQLKNPIHQYTTPGVYTVHLKIKKGNCESEYKENVTVQTFSIANAGPDVTLCSDDPPTSIGITPAMNCSYLWSPATGLSDPFISNPTVSLTNTGGAPVSNIYILTVTNDSTGCVSTDTVKITVSPKIIVNAGANQKLCKGDPIFLTGFISGATGGIWSGGTGTYSPNNTSLQVTYTPSPAEHTAGFVKLTLTTTGVVGACGNSSSNVWITLYSTPQLNFTATNLTGCAPHTVQFSNATAITGDSIISWQWDFKDGTPPGITKDCIHMYTVPNTYNVTLSATSVHGCKDSLTKSKLITVSANPVADFIYVPNPISEIEPEVIFNSQSSSDVVFWFYDFGDGDTLGTIYEKSKHHYSVHNNITSYLVTLIVKNKAGCLDTVKHEVNLNPGFSFFIPNAFTPNDDDVNDVFRGVGTSIATYSLTIFDRWGNLVFKTQYLDEGWDGKITKEHDTAQEDVYVWRVHITDVFNKSHTYLGSVTIIK